MESIRRSAPTVVLNAGDYKWSLLNLYSTYSPPVIRTITEYRKTWKTLQFFKSAKDSTEKLTDLPQFEHRHKYPK